MLIEFSVKNFRSIRERQTLSMVASTGGELREQNTFDSGISNLPHLLRVAVIYGPNAAGKSNLLQAMNFMKWFVRVSSKESQEGEAIKVTPFLFNRKNHSEPSEFEVTFIQSTVRYQYGFAVTSSRVTSEWLIAYPQGKPQRWFEREYDPSSEKDNFRFSKKFIGIRDTWQEATRKNALFLSTAIQLNNEQLKPVFNWFNDLFEIIPPRDTGLDLSDSIMQCKTAEGKKNIIEFMSAADISITDIEVSSKPLTFDKLPKNVPPEVKEAYSRFTEAVENIVEKISEKNGEKPGERKKTELHFFKLLHKTNVENDIVPLDQEDESDGTRKLLSLAGLWMKILSEGSVIAVDELDTSLHPLLVRFLIGLFQNTETNRKNAQLIVATHNTALLDSNLLRRDQVWFVERDEQNATCLYPLSDFSPRKNEAIGKGYLQGRYGAIPFIGEWSF